MADIENLFYKEGVAPRDEQILKKSIPFTNNTRPKARGASFSEGGGDPEVKIKVIGINFPTPVRKS